MPVKWVASADGCGRLWDADCVAVGAGYRAVAREVVHPDLDGLVSEREPLLQVMDPNHDGVPVLQMPGRFRSYC
jgi:hypothetical protein